MDKDLIHWDGRQEKATVGNLKGVKVRVKCREGEGVGGVRVPCHTAGMLCGCLSV